MKSNYSQFSILNSQLIFAMLIFVAGCNSSSHDVPENNRPLIDSITTVIDTADTPKKMLEKSLREFSKAKDDKDKLEALMEACYYAEDLPEEKEKINRQLADFTETAPNCERKVVAYIKLGSLYQESDISRSFVYYQKALELIPKFPDSEKLLKASAYTAMANACYDNGDYEQGQKYAFEAIPILEAQQQKDTLSLKKISINVNNTLLRVYLALTHIYDNIGQKEKMKEYAKKVVSIAEKCSSPVDQASGYIQYAFLNVNDEPEQSLEYINKAYKIGIDNGYVNVVAYALEAYSEYEEVKGNIPSSIMYLKQSLEYLKGKRRPDLEMNVFFNLIHLYPNDEKTQLELSIKGLIIADSLQSKLYSSRYNYYQSALYANAGKYQEAYNHYAKYDSLNNVLLNEQSQRQINYLSAHFDADRREMKITALEKEKQLMIWLGIAGGIVLLLAIATFFFLWRWTIQKRKLVESKNRQLEQEKQLIAAQSLLDGENRERSRLSRDLHDGLGSILAGAKINLLEMKKAATLDTGSLERYDLALSLLDKSMSEMRRIAHHLMPDTLAAVGLKQSIADFVASIPNATFSYYGDESRFDSKLEETVYRITHELVTNALKHSGASQILVDIVRYDNHVTLAVQDDGCGFDPAATSSNGMGMNNIRTRVDAFNGNLTIVSKPGVGTEVNVEFVLN